MSAKHPVNRNILSSAPLEYSFEAAREYDLNALPQTRIGMQANLFDDSQPVSDVQRFAETLYRPGEPYIMLGVWSVHVGIGAGRMADFYTRRGIGVNKYDKEAARELLATGGMLGIVANREAVSVITAIYEANVEEWQTRDARAQRAADWIDIDPDTYARASIAQPNGPGSMLRATDVTELQYEGGFDSGYKPNFNTR